jgi:hypothetical protein
MNKLVSYFLIFFLPIFLGGCNFIDEYYTYDKNYIVEIETKSSPLKDDELRKDLIEVFKSIQIRIKLNNSKTSLLVIQSYNLSKISENLKEKIKKNNVNFDSESKTFDTCNFLNDRNWICKSHNGFGSGYEMKEGELYKDGYKLNHHFSIRF